MFTIWTLEYIKLPLSTGRELSEKDRMNLQSTLKELVPRDMEIIRSRDYAVPSGIAHPSRRGWDYIGKLICLAYGIGSNEFVWACQSINKPVN